LKLHFSSNEARTDESKRRKDAVGELSELLTASYRNLSFLKNSLSSETAISQKRNVVFKDEKL
jgi:hypothetical protein